ncbi:NADH-quinone oxidoreductase subunit N [Meiothermus sp. QL-1]|uniref:proton-conducting transporter transmembrane domain-containing protein n=1 Tax=Meiothermus sp. QL-1 TaxID=2058095 RepID=UPI000E0BE158|nr:proton-conducting transporter membrane subunit [Meiothermus sp. QL-1]RDI94691.1 NADH-quinone oxidoreductase subunit N [Meiothermus sp. QL-1]
MLTLYVLAGFSTLLSLLAFVISREVNRIAAVAALVLAGLFALVGWGEVVEAFGGLYRFDTLARALTLVAVLGGLWALLLGPARKFEFPLLVLYAVTGMHLMASSPNLVVLVIALEIFSLPLYVLSAWQRDEKGFEAGLKYFLLGALGAAIFLYGVALYYGATGSFMAGARGEGPLYAAALFLILAAFAFKTAMVPFQWWSPDVYQGSPTVVTLFMATAVKAAAFAAMLRIFTPEGLEVFGVGLAALVALSLLFGSLGALAQTEAKRLFAYSSIANAGYIGLGLFGPGGEVAVPFYLLTYGLATGLVFAVLSMLSNQEVPLERLRGLWQRRPLLAGAMGLGVLSLLGLPPLAGFWAKYLVFQEAAQAGLYPLVVLALFASVVAAYYYLRVFFLLFSPPDPAQEALDREAEAAVQRFGSSEAPGAPLTGAPLGLSQALMAPAARLPGAATLWAAMALLALLSLAPGLALGALAAKPVAGEGEASFQPPRLAITAPADGASVAPTGFTLEGLAAPNQVVEVFEDGVSLGQAVADGTGRWQLNVPPPAGGLRRYEVRAEGGESARVALRVPEAQAGAICSQSFALANLQAGGEVSRPFRFGGVGSASSYTVLVKRGERVVGRKEVVLSAACGWSYLSDPGPGQITYEVRETGRPESEPPLVAITLNVR